MPDSLPLDPAQIEAFLISIGIGLKPAWERTLLLASLVKPKWIINF